MFKIKFLLLSCLLVGASESQAAPDRSELNTRATQQAAALVAQMTLDEKINLIEMNNLPVERLNIPGHHWWNEALHGVARRGEATQFPVPLSMASTWNPELIKAMATAISDEARALHHADSVKNKAKRYHGLTIWSPVINMARDPRWGRTEESYGEDPYLATELACGFVSGLQGDDPDYLKTVATIKHFVVNNTEHNRLHIRPDVSERALREYYFPAYRDTIVREGVESIMTAYNGLNGIPCSANKWLLTDILRDAWGFKGTVVTDVGVPSHLVKEHTYAKDGAASAAMMIQAGVDVYSGDNERAWTKQAVEQGILKEAELDQAVARGLATRIKLGLLRSEKENPYARISTEVVGSEKHLALARQVAREGTVLLQNKNEVLPATPIKYKSLIFAGPYVNEAPLGGYSGTATRTAATPMLGMKEVAGDVYDIFSQHGGDWLPIPEGNLNLPGLKNSPGVRGEYFKGGKCTGNPVMTRTDRTIYLKLPKSFSHIDPAIPDQSFATRWTAQLTPNRTGNHYFAITARAGAAVWLSGERIISIWDRKAPDRGESKGIYLEAGIPVDLRVEYFNKGGSVQAELKWIEPKTEKRTGNPQEELLVYVGGLSHQMAYESHDLMNLNLPTGQMDEIKELAAIYPNMLVVLNGGTVMQLAELNALVPSILLQWFPGQEGGYALAETIAGKVNPAGRLPLTFYTDTNKLPDFEDYEISKGRTYMYMKDNVTYPFGYGLSYTTFEYSDLKVTQDDQQVKAVLDVTNTGAMDGDEVVQLYVSNLDSKVDQPIRQLRAFKRVTIPKGKTLQVELSVSIDDLAWWNESKQKFVVDLGRYHIQVGRASNDMVCEKIIEISEEFYTPQKDLDGLKKRAEIKADLPNVLLLGDSISIGYTPPVIELLKDVANVQRPGNCGNTTSGLKKIDGWLGDTKWDVIHFNFGLHDLCYRHPDSKEQGHRDKVNGKVSVSLGKYRRNLEALVVRLEETGATLIWASTTPIPEGEAGRVPGDELKYNKAAEEIMKKHGIAIDDLHAVASLFDSSRYEGPGNVHFLKEGSELLGQQVAGSIKAHLPEK